MKSLSIICIIVGVIAWSSPCLARITSGMTCKPGCGANMECLSNCFSVCKPVKKPGFCPPGWVDGISCKNDADCPHVKKCCGRYRTCAMPTNVEERLGKCPATPSSPVDSTATNCTKDADCSGHVMKCCDKVCVQPEPIVKPGVCPDAIQALGVIFRVCSTDQTCKGEEKCCEYDHSTWCKEPLICKNKCRPSEECAEVNCTAPCEKNQCVGVKPGGCPAVVSYFNANGCKNDGDCDGAKKCCRLYCQDPTPNNPGKCPDETTVNNATCDMADCKNDLDCSYHMKCCGASKKKCMNSV